MSKMTEFWVMRGNLRETKVVESEQQPLEDGQIRARIDKMGLTANNVTYALIGEMVGYWKYFPADGEWGKVPGWAMADVIESKSNHIAVGERLYGFFPMSSEVVLTPGHSADDFFMDATPHRQELPALYNQYRRTQGEPEFLHILEDERCLLFPLFITSFVLYDYLLANDLFDAKQIIIGSVSSKTGFGLTRLLKDNPDVSQKIVGITSPGNVAFVETLGFCDQVVTYGNENEIDASLPSAWIDMSGNGPLTDNLHQHLRENMVESCIVGATHWDGERKRSRDLPGVKPALFFAPGHIAKRDSEWGQGALLAKGNVASAEIAKSISEEISFETIKGADAAEKIWLEMLNNAVSPNRGILISF